MKKISWVVLAAVLFGLAGCGKSPTVIPQNNEAYETETFEIPTESTVQLSSYSVYVPNDNADGFDVAAICAEDISAEAVLRELQKHEVLSEAVSINRFALDNGLITIDFNQAFADIVCAMGTSGEYMIVGSVVNTFLDAFHAEYVYFTVDGQILESGHTIYDFDMPFFVDP